MKEISVRRRVFDIREWRNRQANASDVETIVEPGTLLRDERSGELIGAHVDLRDDFPEELLSAVRGLKYGPGFRTGGMKTESRLFGYQPRIALRQDFCTSTTTAREHPREHDVIAGYAEKMTDEYRRLNPARLRRHELEVSKVRDDWKMPRSVFTSGIVNRNNRLAYHRDSGNFSDLWSFMVVFARDIEGGMLALPELGVALRYDGAQYSAFDGAGLIHGVTGIRRRSALAFRYSIVYYALSGMCRCGSRDEELARIRRLKTLREEKRLAKSRAKAARAP